MIGLFFFKALFLVQYGAFLIAFGPKHVFMHYPIVGDSCVYNLFMGCTFDFCRGIHMVYGLYRYTSFHGCEGGLKGVTFYYTEPKHKKKVTFKVQSGPQNACKVGPFEWPLYSLCPVIASIYAFECPMQEIPYERK
jgi:hypothetical protein